MVSIFSIIVAAGIIGVIVGTSVSWQLCRTQLLSFRRFMVFILKFVSCRSLHFIENGYRYALYWVPSSFAYLLRSNWHTYGKEAENDDEFVVNQSPDGGDVVHLFDTWLRFPQQPADHLPRRSLAHVVHRFRLSRREQLQRRKTGDLYHTEFTE